MGKPEQDLEDMHVYYGHRYTEMTILINLFESKIKLKLTYPITIDDYQVKINRIQIFLFIRTLLAQRRSKT